MSEPGGNSLPTTSPRGADPRGADPRIVPLESAVPVAEPEVFDPLRLCIFATIALLGWLLGPIALVFFAGLGAVGYTKARRAGLMRSKCLLGDTRLVLAYLALLVAVGVGALVVGYGPWELW
ncbi:MULTISPECIES: hypothetical protein [unclassified Knoellia]|uniref:hypothetical protein n=1 Tax=Knoellia altitudinis TaxID=3404795 RepID=UPI0036118813